ncbi:MAG TPA: HAMP domain-containing sensor histidine kinase [Planctomycetota bacterium]
MRRRLSALRLRPVHLSALAGGLAWLALGIALVLPRRAAGLAELDLRLATAAGRAAALLAEEQLDADPALSLRRALPGLAPGEACALRAADGRLLAARGVSPGESFPEPEQAADGSTAQALVTLSARADGGPRRRVLTLPFRAGGRPYFLQVARPAPAWWRPVLGLAVPLGLAGLMLALPVGVVAWRGARRARALAGLVEAARALGPEDHARRLPVPRGAEALAELVEALNAALGRLQEGHAAQAQFAGHVAHELKTPLAALVADLQVTLLAGEGRRETDAFLRRAQGELAHMSTLVERFLILGRFDGRELRRERVSVDDVLRSAVQRSRGAAQHRSVRVRLALEDFHDEHPPLVLGDGQLLVVLVENLLQNAILHSPPGTEVVVETTVDSEVHVRVRDHGPGVSAELRAALRSGRMRALARTGGGAGFGLAIVNNIARAHGGHVELEEPDGSGSVFVVRLPAVAQRASSD